jgi:Leucine-rich repeat (LRR) protein
LIEEIPNEIKYLTQLTELVLYNNEIKEIPTEIQFLIQLTGLFLNVNKIKKNTKRNSIFATND